MSVVQVLPTGRVVFGPGVIAGVAEVLRAAYDGRRPAGTDRPAPTQGTTSRVDGRTP